MENSQWFINQAATRNGLINGHNNNNVEGDNSRVDLTLRLGLPDQCDHRRSTTTITQVGLSHVNPIVASKSMAPNHFASLICFSRPTTQGMNQFRIVNQGTTVQGPQRFDGNQYARPPSGNIARSVYNMNYANAFNQIFGRLSSLPSYSNTNFSNDFAPTHHPYQLPTALTSLLSTNNCYTLLDVPDRRTTIQHQREFGTSSSGASDSNSSISNKRNQRHQRVGNYNDPNKRCTNYNCNTNDTPMWRRGPLGPKTLCNACGIKYRKEEEKRKTRETTSRAQQSNSNG